MANPKVTRRNFLKKSSVASLGTALLGIVPTANAVTFNPGKWDMEFDIVVIGGGGGGLAAGCLARQLNQSVVVLEKTGILGGSSLLCGGKWAVTNTLDQHERGIDDNDEKALQDMLKTGQYKNDPELVKAYLKESKEHYEFIRKERGIKPIEITHGGGSTTPRAHHFRPPEVISDMAKYVEEKGGTILKSTKAERLVWDETVKGIGGVRCTGKDGKPLFIRARKGVLLAAGGFANNKDMLAKYNPLMLNATAWAGAGCTGDGILMAQMYGADVLDTQYIKATFCYPPNPNHKGSCQAFWSGAIIVNNKGRRIVDESLSYKLLGDAALAQDKGIAYIVFDEPIRQKRMKAKLVEKAWMELYDQGKEPECAFRGNTIEEVANKAGIDPKVLSETVKRYNDNIDKGIVDPEFGRTSINSGSRKLVKIEKGPFYVYPATARLIATYCGVRIDTKAHVIDVFGQKIPRLYACGEMTGGVHGAAYMTGSSWGKAMAYGRIAVKSMVTEN